MKKAIIAISIACFVLAASITSYANENYHWLVRARVLTIIPDANSNTISTIGGHVSDISNQVVPELDFSYFFTPHIATELILATSRHTVTATGTAIGTIPLGHVSLLPPTLTVQYHFLPTHKVDPYLGAGLNYTFFYDAKARTVNSIHYKDHIGYALQAGADININSRWVLNVDLKKIFLKTKVTTSGPAVHTTADIDPLIIGVGIGYRI